MIARPDHEAQVVRALGSIGVATLASRVLGFVRDMVVARAFGAGPVTDAFFVAFRIPNILRRLLGEGALSTALGPAVMNLGMIVCVLALIRRVDPPIVSLAVGVLVGGVGQLVVQAPDLVRADIPLRPSREFRHPALGRLLRLLVPSIFGLAAVQITIFINTLLASLLRAGSISYLYYADRVMEFPLGVFGIALASAALPPMSRQAAAGDRPGLARTMNFALRLSCYTALPATVGLVLLRLPITRVLFERGHFGPVETAATAWALAWYSLGLVAFSATRIAAQAFYAMGDTRTPVAAGP